MKPLRVAFFGSPEFALPTFEALSRQHDLVIVVSQPDRPAGRGLGSRRPAIAAAQASAAHQRGGRHRQLQQIENERVEVGQRAGDAIGRMFHDAGAKAEVGAVARNGQQLDVTRAGGLSKVCEHPPPVTHQGFGEQIALGFGKRQGEQRAVVARLERDHNKVLGAAASSSSAASAAGSVTGAWQVKLRQTYAAGLKPRPAAVSRPEAIAPIQGNVAA
ncbi:MAG TPA: hypothetical protein PKN52_06010, partial [Trueperaceae bacterium]|nr:hypothetical protein [Trueperaceae bacterium]